jgi:methyl-accepting chemotaxis protein
MTSIRNLLGNMSVRAKLLSGFGVVLVLSAVMGIVLLTQLSAVNSGGDRIGANALPSLHTIDLISEQASAMNGAADAYPEFPAKIQTEITGLELGDAAQVKKLLHTYAGFVDGGLDQHYLTLATAQWTAYEAQPLKIAAATKAGATAVDALLSKTYTSYTALQTTLGKWSALQLKQAQAELKSNHSKYNTARLIGIILLALAILIGIGIAFLLSRSIKGRLDLVFNRIRSLQEKDVSFVRDGMQAFAAGDLTRRYESETERVEEPGTDEIGAVLTAVNDIRDSIVETIADYNSTGEALSQAIGHVVNTAGVVRASSQEMAATSEETGKATGEIARAVSDVAGGAERQVKMIEEVRRSAQEVASAVADSADQAQRASEVAQQARDLAQTGVEAAGEANEAMRSVRDSSDRVTTAITELAAKSEQIGAIVQTITGIAAQTNLLALNAAIEAARAGEQGRGFAVVAEEVRKLAEESEHAAQEISGLIDSIQTETGHSVTVVEEGAKRTIEGATVVERTRETFEQIDASVAEMSEQIRQIAATAQVVTASAENMQVNMNEVAIVAEESSASTEQVSASTEQTSASAQEIAASAQQLSATAHELNELVQQFQTSALV